MSDPFGDRPFPPAALASAGGLIALTLILVMLSGPPDTAPVQTTSDVRHLRFEDQGNGDIAVIDGDTDATVRVIASGTEGFLRATLRNLATERQNNGVGSEVAFALYRRPDGRLALADPVTERKIVLDAFGRDNVAAFARLLEPPPASNDLQSAHQAPQLTLTVNES